MYFFFNLRYIIRLLKLLLEKTRVRDLIFFCIYLGWLICWFNMGFILFRVFFFFILIFSDFFVLFKRIDLVYWYFCLWKMWIYMFRFFWMFLNNLKVVIGKFMFLFFLDFYYRKTLKIVLVSGFFFF